jgi:hypothetical protein
VTALDIEVPATEKPESGRRRPRFPRRLPPMLAVLLPTVVTGLHALAYGRWIVDDAAITFAYARSLATGEGPVLQPGAEPVEGYSNPAWLAVLTLGRLVGLFDHRAWFGVPDYVLFPKAIAALCCVGVFVAGYRAAAAVSPRPALVATAAGLVTAMNPSFVIWCFSGLENSLLALAVATQAAVLVRAAASGNLASVRVAVCCGLLAALAALTRPEGAIYAGAYPLVAVLFVTRAALRRTVGTVLLSALAFVVPFGLYLSWRVAVFDAFLPNTALAKNQSLPTVAELGKATGLAGYVGWPAVLIAVLLAGAALNGPRRLRNGLVALLVPLALAVVAFAVLETDWMGMYRFATPIWPLAGLAAAIAAGYVLPRLAVRGRAVLATVAAVACLFSATLWLDDLRDFRTGPVVPMCRIAQVSLEYNGYARLLGIGDGTLLLPDVGGTALNSNLLIADVAGLTHRRIAEYWGDGDMAGLRDYVFTELRPELVHLHGAWADGTGLLDDPRMDSDYEVLREDRYGVNLVRKDAVPNAQALAAARAFAEGAAARQAGYSSAPRGSCGDVLRPTA